MAELRHGPDVLVDAQREARELLRQGLREEGLRTFAEVWRRVLELGTPVASDRTFRRVFNDGPTPSPHAEQRAAAEVLANLTREPARITAAFVRYWELKASLASRSDRIRSMWWAVVPRQDGRPYASVDRVEVLNQKPKKISGRIVRVLPDSKHEAGLEWAFRGYRRGEQGIFLTFLPNGPNNDLSTGVIYMRRSSYRTELYEGFYVRMDENATDFVTRTYGWYQSVPQGALPRVALLDLDNTLRSGWFIKSWLEFLGGERIRGAYACADRLDVSLDAYARGELSHDALAKECAEAYAELMRGESQEVVNELGGEFVRDDLETFDFVRTLLEELEARSVAPIIVSGAPAEVVRPYAANLGVDEFHALELGVGSDGCFDGTLANNPGLGSVKRRIASELRESFREPVLAVGDSASDLPLFRVAANRIVVGELAPQQNWPSDSVLGLDPDGVSPANVAAWISARIEHDMHFTEQAATLAEDLHRRLPTAGMGDEAS
jgi:phosphoserine phosphatase